MEKRLIAIGKKKERAKNMPTWPKKDQDTSIHNVTGRNRFFHYVLIPHLLVCTGLVLYDLLLSGRDFVRN